ncbi:unnamed protein product [Rodentolepis nana]|uniref:Uncharacterized protein n=1 Tax=Rodentolepis nana TaxID=102285 RepID=A0A0R3T6C6_RODNA|nr:unnamed protein product [Rodentolepis nana]
MNHFNYNYNFSLKKAYIFILEFFEVRRKVVVEEEEEEGGKELWSTIIAIREERMEFKNFVTDNRICSSSGSSSSSSGGGGGGGGGGGIRVDGRVQTSQCRMYPLSRGEGESPPLMERTRPISTQICTLCESLDTQPEMTSSLCTLCMTAEGVIFDTQPESKPFLFLSALNGKFSIEPMYTSGFQTPYSDTLIRHPMKPGDSNKKRPEKMDAVASEFPAYLI